MPLSRLKGRWPTVELALLRLAHAAVLRRLAIEAGWARLMVQVTGRASAPRVVTAACWRFPIYSQTFVQQEAAAMAHAGFALRMFHAETGPRAELAHPCAVLWGLRRRLVLHRSTGADDLAHYRASMPQRVTHLLQRLADAAGLGVDELLRHEHLLQAFSFARAVEAWHADYLHSYFFYEQSLFVWVAANLLDLPRGVSCYADHLLDDYPLKLVALHLATAAVVVATSRRIGAELAMLHGGPLATVLVKPNAVDCASFAARSDIAVAAPGMLRLVCVCRLDPKKGLEYLIDALRLLQLQGTSMELRIVGAPDQANAVAAAYAAALRDQVSTAALSGTVRFLGQCDSLAIRAELQRAEVFVAPFVELANGDKDGIPTAVLEAMAAGCAIVATDAGSIPEIVDDGCEAIVVPQRDAQTLGLALARLAAEPALVRSLGLAAARRARAQFDVVDCERPFHAAVRAAVQTAARRRAGLCATEAGP
jgi:glycosyltransferase involved in cell wall biosynthesis